MFVVKRTKESASADMSPRERSRERLLERKVSPGRILSERCSSLSDLVQILDYEPYTRGVLSAVPEREWRLLGVLLRKREEDADRAELAERCHRMWERERRERLMDEAESSEQRKRYLEAKRQQDRMYQEIRSTQKMADQRLHKQSIIEGIRTKDMRAAEVLANVCERKVEDMVEKAMQDEARQRLAASNRSRHSAAQDWQRRVALVGTMMRVDGARQRRQECLKDISKRKAIDNALSLWDSAVARQEMAALEYARRCQLAAHAAQSSARGERLLHAREARRRRARDVAALCALMRDAARSRSPGDGLRLRRSRSRS